MIFGFGKKKIIVKSRVSKVKRKVSKVKRKASKIKYKVVKDKRKASRVRHKAVKNKVSKVDLKIKLEKNMEKERDINLKVSEGELKNMEKEREIDIKVSEVELKNMEKEKEIDIKVSEVELKKNSIKKNKDMIVEIPKEIAQDRLIEYSNRLSSIRAEIGKIVVGHEKAVDGILRGILANGHVLIEGVPGIAKTLLIRCLAEASGCQFSRVQFTVDLLPTDITGVTTYDEKARNFVTIKGPIFSNFIIADEINRAPPKTQSALLEAMQEKQVTIGKGTHALTPPFFVMANNNPLESSGTYPLPEAQVDRFLFKLKMGYPENKHEEKIIDQNITTSKFEDYKLNPIASPAKIIKMQEATKKIIATNKIKKYVVSIVDSTRNSKKYDIKMGKYIEWGCSPRASIGLIIAAKADSLMKGSQFVTPENVKNVAHDVLRHRIIMNYEGQAENIDADKIIDEILAKVKVP